MKLPALTLHCEGCKKPESIVYAMSTTERPGGWFLHTFTKAGPDGIRKSTLFAVCPRCVPVFEVVLEEWHQKRVALEEWRLKRVKRGYHAA